MVLLRHLRHRIAPFTPRVWRSCETQPSFMSFSSNAQLRTFSKPEEYDRKYLVHTYNADGIRGKEDTFFTHGEGQYLFDQNGQKYLDFCAGIAVTGLGHNDPDWQAALVQGAKVGPHMRHQAFSVDNQ